MAAVAFLSLPMMVIIGMMAITGTGIGITGPSRDILVRAATPRGATGKVFGFVYSGLDLGSASAPLIFGWLMDGGQYRGIFMIISLMYVLGILSVLQLKRGGQPEAAAAG